MKTQKTKNKKYILILLAVLLLGLAVGYAAFSDTLAITGTANANGTFDMNFVGWTKSNAVGVDPDRTKCEILDGGDTLRVVVADLAYPGAGVQFNVTIENDGRIPAKVKSVAPINITGNDAIIITGLDDLATHHNTDDTAIDLYDTCTFSFTVQWDPNHSGEFATEEDKQVEFNLAIEYEQVVDTFTGSASHTM